MYKEEQFLNSEFYLEHLSCMEYIGVIYEKIGENSGLYYGRLGAKLYDILDITAQIYDHCQSIDWDLISDLDMKKLLGLKVQARIVRMDFLSFLQNTLLDTYSEANTYKAAMSIKDKINNILQVIASHAPVKINQSNNEENEELIHMPKSKGDELRDKLQRGLDDHFYRYINSQSKKENENEIDINQKLKNSWDEIETLKETLEKERNALAKLNEEAEKAKTSYTELKEDISQQKENVTSIGLAKSFSQEVNKLRKNVIMWICFFVATLFILTIAIVIILYTKVFFSPTDSDINTLINFLKTVTITGPMIWLALFCAKCRGESHRLYNEYLHKKHVSESYNRHKQQVDDLQENGQEMLEKLLTATIDVIKENPSHTLHTKNSANLPTKEAIDYLTKIMALKKE